jgi:hypothetical protein
MSITFTVARFVEFPADHEIHPGTVLVQEPCDYEVNMSNANAFAVLDRLGYSVTEPYGEATPEEFLGRALVANVGLDDSGVDGATTYLIDGPVMHDCGRRAGYFDDRLGRLAWLAEYARDHELMISWG